MTLVVGDRHLERGISAVPCWWGVLHVYTSNDGLKFKAVRRPQKNRLKDARSLVELLWLDDAIKLLEERGAAQRSSR